MEIEYGYCHCGCGNKTKTASDSCKKENRIKGKPMKFISGHNCIMEINPNWKGGRITAKINGEDKILIRCDGRYRYEHALIAEIALGHPLPEKSHIHHVNGHSDDNRNSNLVICENASYHKILHMRTRALKGCGHADWRKCTYCKKYDSTDNLSITISKRQPSGRAYHRSCNAEYGRILRKKHTLKKREGN